MDEHGGRDRGAANVAEASRAVAAREWALRMAKPIAAKHAPAGDHAARLALAADIAEALQRVNDAAAVIARQEADAGRADLAAGDVPKDMAAVKVQTAANIEASIRAGGGT